MEEGPGLGPSSIGVRSPVRRRAHASCRRATLALMRPGTRGPDLPAHKALGDWVRSATRADRTLALILGLYGLYLLALWPLVPALLGSHPLLLETISGSVLAEVAVGAHSRLGELPLWLAVAAGVPGTMMFDWVFWLAGRRWGDRALHLFSGRATSPRQRARREARTARLERMADRFGPVAVVLAYYLPVPNVLIFAVSGLSGMRLRTFLALDLIGTLLWVGPIVGLGYGLGRSAVDVVHRIDHYSTLVSIAVLVAVIGVQAWRYRPRRGHHPGALDPEE